MASSAAGSEAQPPGTVSPQSPSAAASLLAAPGSDRNSNSKSSSAKSSNSFSAQALLAAPGEASPESSPSGRVSAAWPAHESECGDSLGPSKLTSAQAFTSGQLVAKTWRQRLYLFVEVPDSSLPARITSQIIVGTIVSSIVCFVLESMPEWRREWKQKILDVVEVSSTAIFTSEYILRFIACDAFATQTRLGFLKNPLNILDFLAFLPFYVEKVLSSIDGISAFRVLRAIRLIRVFRVFKLSKYSLGMNLLVEALTNSVHPLIILLFFLSIGVILFSSLLYYAERMSCPDVEAMTDAQFSSYQSDCVQSSDGWAPSGDLCCNKQGSATEFESIAMTFWWSIVTMTTVGYGDMVPRTGLGRLVAGVAMIAGIVLISLPVAVVGAKFQQAYENYILAKAKTEAEKREREEAEVRSERPSAIQTMTGKALGAKILGVVKVQNEMTLLRGAKCDAPVEPSPVLASSSSKIVPTDAGGQPSIEASKSGANVDQSKSKKTLDEQAMTNLPTMEAITFMKQMLKQLEEKEEMSEAAQDQIQLILELFDHIERVEKKLARMRDKDAALDALIRKDFAALSRCYSAAMERDPSKEVLPSSDDV